MSELIKPQCADCPYFDVTKLWPTERTRFEIRALRMALEGTEEFAGCRHPWRVMNEIYGPNPNPEQVLVLSSLIKVRGKDPTMYGLPTDEGQAEEAAGVTP